jgi:hypothetical protein
MIDRVEKMRDVSARLEPLVAELEAIAAQRKAIERDAHALAHELAELRADHLKAERERGLAALPGWGLIDRWSKAVGGQGHEG